MSILDTFIDIFVPHPCLTCGTEGALLCRACQKRLLPVQEVCYRCRKPSPKAQTCIACRNASSLYKVQAATTYTGIAKTLVWKLKFSGAQAAAKTMTSLMAGLAEAEKGSILVAVPTATSRVRQRGYDQSKLLARALSKQTGLPRLSLLGRAGQAQQHGASRQERISQLKNDFRIAPLTDVRNKHIILVDDVITTGATLESAAAILLAAGAKQVDGLIFAQTPLAIK